MSTESPRPLTANEHIKAGSDYLRGTIIEALNNHSKPCVSNEDVQLLKFLGATQQDNRDTRAERKKAKQELDYSFMLRLRLPGGRISPQQWLEMDKLADTYGNGTLKLTTRQSVQIHGVIKKDLRTTMQAIHEASLSAIASSGDATRNVMVSHHPSDSVLHAEVLDTAQQVSRELEPRTRAYHEIWLNEKRCFSGAEEEPLYGKDYLPRKFKIAFTLPPDNDVDVYCHDLSFVAIVEHDRISGYDVLVGGGQGCAYGNPKSFPRLADVVGFCRPEDVLQVSRAVLTIHRDFSDRTDRKLSRLRYTIANRGLAWFNQELTKRLGRPLPAARPFTLTSNADPAAKSSSRISIFVQGGRVKDTESSRLKTAIREIAAISDKDFYISANENLCLYGISPKLRHEINAILAKYNIVQDYSGLRLNAISCTSLPFCPMAFTDSERFLPKLIESLEPLLRKYYIWHQPIITRMTGCSNGCSRPHVAELAFMGKAPGKYNVLLGGAPNGSRLAYVYKEGVKGEDIPALLEPVFKAYGRLKHKGESFGEWTYTHRAMLEALRDERA